MRIVGKCGFAALLLALACAWAGADDRVAADRSLFWSVSNADGHQAYLLGTIHSEDPRVLEFTDEFLGLLSECGVFAMELVPNLRTLARLSDIMQLPEGSSLSAITGKQRFDQVVAALASYGLPAGEVDRMKPWAAMMTLSVPAPQTGFFMDFSLSLRAAGEGLEVVGLETLEQQLAFLEDMPVEQQLQLLDHAVEEFDRVGEVHDLMVDTYLLNDLQELAGLAAEQLQALDAQVREYFMAEGIDRRNRRMLEALLPTLERGCVFAAVGALHLPGQEGLLSHLREHGYRLEPLDLPLVGTE
jgi:uncharacterized protein YbaP (TraB family)